MNFQLISSLVRSAWFIDPQIAENFYHAVALLIEGKPVDIEFKPFKPSFYHNGKITMMEMDGENIQLPEMEAGAVMVMPLNGVLMKNDQTCGPVGTRTMGNILKAADENENIAGTVLHIDSPGGQADGTGELSNVIKNLKKPVVSYVDGMAASAGYWIASAADKVVAAPRATVGSIGAMLSFADVQPELEAKGIRFHKIVSDQTPDKNALFEKVRTGDYTDYKQQFLNPLAQDFIDAVKQNRPAIEATQTTGKTFFAENTIGNMVDQIGSIEDAVNMVNQMSTPKTPTTNPQTPNSKPNIKMLDELLTQLEVERQDDGVFLSFDLLEQLEGLIQERAAVAEPVAQDTPEEPTPAPATPEPTPEPTQQDAVIAQMTETMNQLQQRLDAMENTPGAETARVKPKTDPGKPKEDNLATDPKLSFWENVQKVKEAYLD